MDTKQEKRKRHLKADLEAATSMVRRARHLSAWGRISPERLAREEAIFAAAEAAHDEECR